MHPLLEGLQTLGLLDEPATRRVIDEQARGRPLEEAILASPGGRSAAEWLEAFAQVLEWPCVDLSGYAPPADFLSAFPARLLLEHQLLPLREEGGVLWVATGRPTREEGLDELRVRVDRPLRPALAAPEEIERCLQRHLGVGADTMQTLAREFGGPRTVQADGELDIAEAAQDASIVRFVNEILAEALRLRATDVHIEPYERELRVRYRVDGVLRSARLPAQTGWFQAAIVSRLKILSQLDIAEKRLPQDGRVRLKVESQDVDVRVSIIPMLHGEGVVLRLLDRDAPRLGLARLGLAERDREALGTLLELPHGIILVTGPTGSGKTTSLYAALSEINDEARKIITIEDPVEYHIRGINQIQVSTKTGLDFARGLRSILRHDPDVMLIGEIRDLETAEIAVQASLTGHLVFSTLHTNDAPGALTRLVDMGVERFLVASSLEAVMAQRLVRMICEVCREELPPRDPAALERAFGAAPPATLPRGRGCRGCQETGYRGRMGIFELMVMDDALREGLLARASSGELRRHAAAAGMRGLRQDGWRLVCAGRTTPEEVLRVTRS